MKKNMKNNLKNNKYLFLGTVAFFGLAFINIHFAILGIVCMTIPFVLLFRDGKKTWCSGYCPRASLFTTLGTKWGRKGKKIPMSFIKGNVKNYVLAYFGIALFITTMSTLRVARGGMPPLLYPRFLIFIPLNVDFPQLFELTMFAPWVTHLSFRLFSMMMTTTVFGLILSYLYKPRTWCTICPISTLSGIYIMEGKKKNPIAKAS